MDISQYKNRVELLLQGGGSYYFYFFVHVEQNFYIFVSLLGKE